MPKSSDIAAIKKGRLRAMPPIPSPTEIDSLRGGEAPMVEMSSNTAMAVNSSER